VRRIPPGLMEGSKLASLVALGTLLLAAGSSILERLLVFKGLLCLGHLSQGQLFVY